MVREFPGTVHRGRGIKRRQARKRGRSVQYSNLALQLETAQLYAVDVEVGEQAF